MKTEEEIRKEIKTLKMESEKAAKEMDFSYCAIVDARMLALEWVLGEV